MLKIKRKYLGTILMKEGNKITLHKDMTQKELLFVQSYYGKQLVQEIKIVVEEDDNIK